MAKVKVTQEVGASASAVWELVRDFGGIEKWSGAGIEGCSVEGEGIGAVRTIRIPGGAELKERLEAFDDAGRSFQYSIVGDGPLPVRDYLSTLTVVEGGAERCTVDRSSRFEPAGADEARVKQILEGVYRGGIAGIKKTLGA